MAEPILLPGEIVAPSLLPLPSDPSRALKLGPGLHHNPPSTITSTIAGTLHTDPKKHLIWIENNSGRYNPTPTDPVIATIHHSSTDYYHCILTPHTPPALLPHLAFESATKKTRPNLAAGSLVCARIVTASKFSETELTCVNPATGKSEGLGPLTRGGVFDVSLGMARRLLMPGGKGGVVVLEEMGERVVFEVAVGRNGRVWVGGAEVRVVLAVGRALVEVDEGAVVGLEEQRGVVRRICRGLGV